MEIMYIWILTKDITDEEHMRKVGNKKVSGKKRNFQWKNEQFFKQVIKDRCKQIK